MTASESGRLDINGTRLAFEWGGQGPSVVLLHGFSLDLRMWEDQFAALGQRFRVLRYDRRGFGRSALPETGVPFSTNEDLSALLVHLGIRKTHLIGLSAGGAVAINFALEHPESVDRIVLVDSALDGFAWSQGWTERWNEIERLAATEGVGAARASWLSHPLFVPAREHPGLEHRLEAMVREYSGWHWLHDEPTMATGPPAAKRLREIAHPTLVMVGEQDLPDFHAIAHQVANGISGARKEVIPDAGHLLNMESPERFNQSVLQFL